MKSTREKACATLEQYCKSVYNKYGEWVNGVWMPYDDMEEC